MLPQPSPRLDGPKKLSTRAVYFFIKFFKNYQINGFLSGIASQKERFLKTFFDFCKGEIPATGFEATTKFCCNIENVL